MSEIIHTTPIALPEPKTPITIRVGTREDIAFMDRLQKKHSKALGFFPRAQMEGYIDAGNVLIAEEGATGEKLGYVASKDRYLKRDELGAIFQMCVAPGYERKFIAANLLREVFERSSYGCRLYCCWCAQDLPANKFWEAMGFVPIAYRAGGRRVGQVGESMSRADASTHRLNDSSTYRLADSSNHRVHIFWQKRIRAGDDSTPYWFPAKTEGGAIREDRIILPIPPGMRWTDELPLLIPQRQTERLLGDGTARPGKQAKPDATRRGPCRIALSRLSFAPANATKDIDPKKPSQRAKSDPTKATTDSKKVKADPVLIARARELRDRWTETVGAHPDAIAPSGKYHIARVSKAAGQSVQFIEQAPITRRGAA